MEQQTISLHYQRMEDWLVDRRVVLSKKYNREYERLLQLAPKLVQIVKYDLPAQQRLKQRLSSAVDDAHRAIEEATKSAEKFEEKRIKMIEVYGLQTDCGLNTEADLGEAVESRTASSITTLSEVLREFVGSCWLATFRSVYDSVVSTHSLGMYSGDVFSRHFPWLERVYEERFYASAAGVKQVEEAAASEPELNGGSGFVIDWGDTGVSEPVDASAAVEIAWETDEIVADGGADDEECQLPTAAEGEASVAVANAAHRKNILAELEALRCFASERANAGDDSLVQCRDSVLALEKRLTVSTEAFFVRMHANPANQAAFIDKIQRFRRAATTAATRRVGSEARLQQVVEELREMEPQLYALLQSARALREECLSELTKMFPGQRVVIVGDINKFL